MVLMIDSTPNAFFSFAMYYSNFVFVLCGNNGANPLFSKQIKLNLYSDIYDQ